MLFEGFEAIVVPEQICTEIPVLGTIWTVETGCRRAASRHSTELFFQFAHCVQSPDLLRWDAVTSARPSSRSDSEVTTHAYDSCHSGGRLVYGLCS